MSAPNPCFQIGLDVRGQSCLVIGGGGEAEDKAERSLVNCFDSPRWSSFGMVALVSAGHLRLGISTSNTSPSLASRLRQDLELLFDEVFVDYIEQLGRVRSLLKDTMADPGARREVLRSLVGDFHLTGALTYPEDWRQRAAEILGNP